MLEMAVLGLLKGQDMHGYELKKRLSDLCSFPSAVSFGSLYPALARLEAAGAVRALAPGRDRAAPSISSVLAERRASRRRKVYSITPLGAGLFEELLLGSQGASEDERSFNLRLAFARYLPPTARVGLLEHRRAILGDRLAQLAAGARARRDDRYMRILVERQQESLDQDVSWLERLITEERAAEETTSVYETPAATARQPGPPAAGPPAVPLVSASQLVTAGGAQATSSPLHIKDGIQ